MNSQNQSQLNPDIQGLGPACKEWSQEDVLRCRYIVAKPHNIDFTSLLQVRKFGETGDRESLMKLSRDNMVHDFWAHSSHMCEICSDLCDFEKPAKIEEMVREVERMRAKAAKRPPLRVVQGGECRDVQSGAATCFSTHYQSCRGPSPGRRDLEQRCDGGVQRARGQGCF